MFQLVRTRQFDRQLAPFVRAHPKLKAKIGQLVRDLESAPFQPHLRLHARPGEFQGLYAASLTYSYRVTMTLRLAEREVVLLGIGSHDDVYR